MEGGSLRSMVRSRVSGRVRRRKNGFVMASVYRGAQSPAARLDVPASQLEWRDGLS